jgi:hypothetical protein
LGAAVAAAFIGEFGASMNAQFHSHRSGASAASGLTAFHQLQTPAWRGSRFECSSPLLSAPASVKLTSSSIARHHRKAGAFVSSIEQHTQLHAPADGLAFGKAAAELGR